MITYIYTCMDKNGVPRCYGSGRSKEEAYISVLEAQVEYLESSPLKRLGSPFSYQLKVNNGERGLTARN